MVLCPSIVLFDQARVLAAVPGQPGGAYVRLNAGRQGEGLAFQVAHADVPVGSVAVLLVVSVEDARRLGALDLPERVV